MKKSLQKRLNQYAKAAASITKEVKSALDQQSISKSAMVALPVAGVMLGVTPDAEAQIVRKKEFRKIINGVVGATQSITGSTTNMTGLQMARSFQIVLKDPAWGTERIEIDAFNSNNITVKGTNKANLRLAGVNNFGFIYAEPYDVNAGTTTWCGNNNFAAGTPTYLRYPGQAAGFAFGVISNLGFRISSGGNNYFGFARIRVDAGQITYYGASWQQTAGNCFSSAAATNAILPVEFTSFDAVPEQRQINLRWKTATEQDNSGFEIERSMNGKEFESIGFIRGSGTTFNEQTYSYEDHGVEMNQTYYYRLKQIDYSGKASYTNIQAAKLETNDGEVFSLFPNPSNGLVKMDYHVDYDTDLSIFVYDIAGKEVYQNTVSVAKGKDIMDIDLSTLDAGSYFVKFETETGHHYQKLMIQ